jgi:esterase
MKSATSASELWSIPTDVSVTWVNDYPMSYVQRGRGETVLLVHGAATDYRIWEGVIHSLSKRHHVMAVSLRHYYPEPWDGSGAPISVEQDALDLAALIRSLDAPPVHLVGHSRGGTVVLQAALNTPALVKSVVLLDGVVTFDSSPPDPRTTEYVGQVVASVRSALLAGNKADAGKAFVEGFNRPGAWEAGSDEARQMIKDNIVTVAHEAEEGRLIASSALAASVMPLLCVTGEKSPRVFTAGYDRVADLREVERATVPAAGHVMHIDNPQFVTKLLADFIAGA